MIWFIATPSCHATFTFSARLELQILAKLKPLSLKQVRWSLVQTDNTHTLLLVIFGSRKQSPSPMQFISIYIMIHCNINGRHLFDRSNHFQQALRNLLTLPPLTNYSTVINLVSQVAGTNISERLERISFADFKIEKEWRVQQPLQGYVKPDCNWLAHLSLTIAYYLSAPIY